LKRLSELTKGDGRDRKMRRFVAACLPEREAIINLWGPKRVVVEWAGDWDGEDDYEIRVFDLDMPDRADRIDIADVYDELSRQNQHWSDHVVTWGEREFDRLFNLYIHRRFSQRRNLPN
jgi:hypothetical protein